MTGSIMMGVIIALLFAFGWPSFGADKPKRKTTKQLSKYQWIVNGEFVDMDPDRHELVFAQEMEDLRIYQNYERWKLKEDREYLFNVWEKTISRLHMNPELIKVVTSDKMIELKPKYDHYLLMHSKIKESDHFLLTQEQWVAMYLEPMIFGACLKISMRPPEFYRISHEKSAKYMGDCDKKLREEFKAKWY